MVDNAGQTALSDQKHRGKSMPEEKLFADLCRSCNMSPGKWSRAKSIPQCPAMTSPLGSWMESGVDVIYIYMQISPPPPFLPLLRSSLVPIR